MIKLDNIGLNEFVCVRRDLTVVQERKFVARCGEKVVARLNSRGSLVEVLAPHNCKDCKAKAEFVENLIQSGK